MLRSASSASGEAGLLVIATVSAPARPASVSIWMVSSVRPVVEMPIATVSVVLDRRAGQAGVHLGPGVRAEPDPVEPALQLLGEHGAAADAVDVDVRADGDPPGHLGHHARSMAEVACAQRADVTADQHPEQVLGRVVGTESATDLGGPGVQSDHVPADVGGDADPHLHVTRVADHPAEPGHGGRRRSPPARPAHRWRGSAGPAGSRSR